MKIKNFLLIGMFISAANAQNYVQNISESKIDSFVRTTFLRSPACLKFGCTQIKRERQPFDKGVIIEIYFKTRNGIIFSASFGTTTGLGHYNLFSFSVSSVEAPNFPKPQLSELISSLVSIFSKEALNKPSFFNSCWDKEYPVELNSRKSFSSGITVRSERFKTHASVVCFFGDSMAGPLKQFASASITKLDFDEEYEPNYKTIGVANSSEDDLKKYAKIEVVNACVASAQNYILNEKSKVEYYPSARLLIKDLSKRNVLATSVVEYNVKFYRMDGRKKIYINKPFQWFIWGNGIKGVYPIGTSPSSIPGEFVIYLSEKNTTKINQNEVFADIYFGPKNEDLGLISRPMYKPFLKSTIRIPSKPCTNEASEAFSTYF